MDGVIENLAVISQSLGELAKNNRETVHDAINDLASLIKDLKKEIPPVVDDIKKLTSKVCTEITPTVQNTIEKMSARVDDAITDVSKKVGEASDQIGQIARKINGGEGTLGKLINDDKPLQDVKVTVKCVQNALSVLDKIRFGGDIYGESLHAFGEKACFNHDFKGYADIFLYPRPDIFVMAGLVGDQRGSVTHKDIFDVPLTHTGNDSSAYGHDGFTSHDISRADGVRQDVRAYNHWLWNLQAGAIFDRFQLRAGIFESTFGVACDIAVPLPFENGTWITGIEAFDFSGRNRIDDDRAHLRWINRLFFNSSFYLLFGLDDFIGRSSKSFFFGAGLCFGSCYFPCKTGQMR